MQDHAGKFQLLGQENQLRCRPEAVQGVQGTGEHAGGQSSVKHPAVLWWGRRMEEVIEKEWEVLGFHRRSHQLPEIQAKKNISVIQSTINTSFKNKSFPF